MLKKVLYTPKYTPKESFKERDFHIGATSLELIPLSWIEQQKQRLSHKQQQLNEQRIQKLPKPLSYIDIACETEPPLKLNQKIIQSKIDSFPPKPLLSTSIDSREDPKPSGSLNAISDSDSRSSSELPIFCYYQHPRPIL